MNRAAKQYAPVSPLQKATGIVPLYIAWYITDELEHYFWVTLPEDVCYRLADRAERAWAHNANWRRKLKGPYGREWLRLFMRHWLSGLLYKEWPGLFRQLPDSYKIGHPLPLRDTPRRQSEPARTRPTTKTSVPPSTAKSTSSSMTFTA